MIQDKSLRVATYLVVLLFCLLSSFYCSPVSAQTDDSLAEQKQQARDLVKQNKYTEALPILEKLVVAEPDNAESHFYLGFALIAQAHTVKDVTQRKALRVRARQAFVRA